ATWHKGTGNWEKKTIAFEYPIDMHGSYLALQMKAPGAAYFNNVSLIPEVKSSVVDTPQVDNVSSKTLIKNPGFELSQSSGSQSRSWVMASGVTVSKGVAAEGDYSLKLTTKNANFRTHAIQSGIATEPGQYYRLTYKVRAGEGSTQTTGYQQFMVFASWDPVVENGLPQTQIQQLSGRTFQDTFAAWQERTLEFFAPDTPSAGMVIHCHIKGPGTAYFDDFNLTKVTPPVQPALELSLQTPHYRNTIYADAPIAEIQGNAKIMSPAVTNLKITLGLANQEPVFSQSYKVKNDSMAFSIPADKLKEGEYQLQAQAIVADGSSVYQQTLSILKVPAAKHTVRVREDNVILTDGKPFFPIGLWRISDGANGYDAKELYEFNQAGINTFLTAPDPIFLQQSLDQAAKYNLKPIFNMRSSIKANIKLYRKGLMDETQQKVWRDTIDKIIATAANHRAFLGYITVDEPLWCGYPLEPIQAAYDYFRRADPNHPIYINAAPRNTPQAVSKFAAASDLFGLDIYPVPQGGSHSDLDDKTISCVGKYTDRMRLAVNDRKPVIMTLQAFAWGQLYSNTAAAFYPTYEQSRFMAYNAILHGAKGLMYWGTHSIKRESFWKILFRTTSEIRDMSAVLTSPSGEAGKVACSSKNISLMHKVCEQNDFIISANESDSQVEAVFHTSLPDSLLYVLFENRTVAVTNGTFTDTFIPYGVHIYSTTAQLPAPLIGLTSAPDPGGESAHLVIMKKRNALVPYVGKANWIWYPGKSQTPYSQALFRRDFVLSAKVKSANLLITADDQYICYVNGKEVGKTGIGWSQADLYNVTSLLHEGTNTLAVIANDSGSAPCGLLAELSGTTVNGEVISIISDASWHCAETTVPSWTENSFNADVWPAVEVLGPYGSGVWRKRLLRP
ncbi:MAG: hypothetical protein JKX85_13435, partial [Phycisphaeraceae bacterium]|nr:hypothetical protein [Phycisphaeraceae bacterium]